MPLFKPREKPSLDDMKEEVIRLIDESGEVIYKIAFYSQPEVQAILKRVSAKWEENNFQGRPIDYTTEEEIIILYKLAKKISSKRPEELYREYGRAYMP